ncbi:ATP-binding protein [Sphingomonas sp. AX6]|uniref:ATP-binding protein n=1 Tax=Sphingomonas sp. AX6 TaxID=2653171 RepID=UPI0012F3861E|nr:ATP-binding protein [Sphingomonas sp. AX6]VXC84657.1 conserved hypothetical protein [Sphingomonas sp. AX6]
MPPKITSSGAFAPEELLPRSGSPMQRETPEKLTALHQRHAAIRSIFIHNPNHVGVFKSLDMVIALGSKGIYQTGVRNAAESYAGKSSSADEFARIIGRRGTYPAEARPIVRVELEQACTPKRFWLAILAAYGDGFASSKDEEQLRRSAYEAFEKHSTVLLIIDEVQHSGYRSKGFSAPTDVIKRFISDAQVGLGLFGNEKAKELLESNNQLSHRLLPPCDIQPLDLADPAEQERFRSFVRKYDKALEDQKLFTTSADLHDERALNCLMAVSRGYLGRFVTLAQVAARHAFLRDADAIEFCDLSFACTTWAVGQKLTSHDPFRFGVGGINA